MEKQRVCANGPTMSRRTLLAAIPATAALALPASASIEDPILPHYREWLAAGQEWEDASELPGNDNFEFPESIEAENRKFAAADRMIETTPTSSAGLAALVHILWDDYGPGCIPGTDLYAEECEHRDNKLILAIWRGATGGDGTSYPEQLYPRAAYC